MKKSTRNKTRKLIKKKQKGGEVEYFVYGGIEDPNENWGTKDLGLDDFQAEVVHHHKMNVNILANLNLYKGVAQKTVKALRMNTYNDDFCKYIITKYYSESINETSMYKVVRDFLGGRGFGEGRTWLVGEATDEKKKVIPIFLFQHRGHARAGYGYFCDINLKEHYLQNHVYKNSGIIQKPIYEFATTPESIKVDNAKISETANSSNRNISNKTEEYLEEDMVLKEQERGSMYMFERIGMNKVQKQAINNNYFDWRKIYDLNNDETMVRNIADGEIKRDEKNGKMIPNDNDKHLYRTNERFGFFNYDLIKIDNDDYKKAFFVGFCINGNKYTPVFLKEDGWFSTGGWGAVGDVYPSYESINITEDILNNINMLQKYEGDKILDYSYLINKTAYIFRWKLSIVSYNQQFRAKNIVQWIMIMVKDYEGAVEFLTIIFSALNPIGGLSQIIFSLLYSVAYKGTKYSLRWLNYGGMKKRRFNNKKTKKKNNKKKMTIKLVTNKRRRKRIKYKYI